MDLYSTGSVGTTTLRQHMLKTFTWMFLGVLITFATAFFVGTVPAFSFFYSSFPMAMILLFAQLGVVIALSARLFKMKEHTAKALFLLYCALTGITFSSLAFFYEAGDIAVAFIAAAVFFGCLVIIGATTKVDLSKIGVICIAGLFAMIVFQLFGMLFGWGMDLTMYAIIGLVLFMGITAWDVQKAKKLYTLNQDDDAALRKLSIYSAFQLYLDFINIFLYILRILGNSRN